MSQTTIPTNPGKMTPSTISDLKSAIVAMANNTFVNSSFVSNTNQITIPAVGTLIKASPFSTMQTDANSLSEVCAFNSSCFNFSNDFCFTCGSDCDF